MGFMGGIFKALGFESETKTKTKKKKTKASYNLTGDKKNRVDQIDGVPVYYPENAMHTKDFAAFVKEGRAVIISKENMSKEEGDRMLDFLEGFSFGTNAKVVVLSEDKLYLILPEGMEVEE